MIRDIGYIELAKPSGRPRLARPSESIQEGKVSARRLAKQMGISKSSALNIE